MIRFVPKIEVETSTIKSAKPKFSKTVENAVAGDNAESPRIRSESLSPDPVAEPLELLGDAPAINPATRRKKASVTKKAKAKAIDSGHNGGDLLVGLEA